jgi:Zn-dependent protease/CBS domain-containing protein
MSHSGGVFIMRGSLKIGRIAGIEIGIHYSWILAFALFIWIFAMGAFRIDYPGWSISTYWIAGAITSIMIFVSVLIHELCHSLVAKRKGLNVSSIVFFIFGGVSNLENEPEKASVEFVMSVAGPLSSFILAGIFFGVAYLLFLPGNIINPNGPVDPVIGVLYYFGRINFYLAIFNIVPGFPLDGGRVLRSIIWGITKSLYKATMIAGNVGRAFGWLMIICGVLLFFSEKILFIQGGTINGIWLILIGWFITSGADNAMRETTLQQELAGVRVKDVMDRTPECVFPGASVEAVVHESFIQHGRRAVPVCSDFKLMGIVTLADVKRLPQDRWSNTPIQEVMTRTPLLSVGQNDDLNGALKILAQHSLNQIAVVEEGRLVGLLSRADIIRYLQTRQELGVKNSGRSLPI